MTVSPALEIPMRIFTKKNILFAAIDILSKCKDFRYMLDADVVKDPSQLTEVQGIWTCVKDGWFMGLVPKMSALKVGLCLLIWVHLEKNSQVTLARYRQIFLCPILVLSKSESQGQNTDFFLLLGAVHNYHHLPL